MSGGTTDASRSAASTQAEAAPTDKRPPGTTPMSWHTCSFYCHGEIHAVPVLCPPEWEREEVWASFRHYPQTNPDDTLLALLPAREADAARWAGEGDWSDGYGAASHPPADSRPWLALIRIPSLPPAP